MNVHIVRVGEIMFNWLRVLTDGKIEKGLRPFCFKNMWLKAEGSVERVKAWWDSYHSQGTPSYKMAMKF